jgi:PAS domain S-box-containing protein
LDYHIILDEAPDAIFIVDKHLKIIDVNKHAALISGYTKAELLKTTLYTLFPESELKKTPFDIKGIGRSEVILLERKIQTKTGKTIPVEIKLKKLPDGNYYSSLRDINSRIKARQNLQKIHHEVETNEFRYRNLFDNMPLGVFVVNKTGSIEKLNPAMIKILGSPSIEDSLKFNIFDLPTLKATELLQDLKTCFKNGTRFHKIYDYKSLWGKEAFVKAHILPAEQSNSDKVLVIIENYTAQKENDLQLKILSKGVDNSPASVVVTNAEGEIIFVNQTFVRLTGYSFEEVKGKTPRILKSGNHSEAFYKDLWDTITSGNNWIGEFQNKKKNGEIFWESTMITSLKNRKGETSHFMAIKEDVTEKKKVETELKAAKEKAEEADLLKSSFLANMSHEIRTPLNAILGFSGILNEYDINSQKSAKFIKLIQTNSKQLLNIIDDVLLVSKLQVDQIKVYTSAFSVSTLLNELYTNFNKEIEIDTTKNIELALIIDSDSKADIIETDKLRLNQILTKLIRNALKFTTKGVISFGLRQNKNKEIIFFVEDTGIGIPQKKQKIIFQKFRQADDSKTRQFGGTGLGLSIVKGLIDLLKGDLWLESEEDKGTVFYFTVPLKIIKQRGQKIQKDKLKWKDRTILLVDDVKESIILITEILQATGIQIITATNGIQAIEKFSLHPEIDLILMDIQLPKLNGLATAKRILARKNVPIIAQSAYLQQEYEKQCEQIGCTDFIQKPINADELMLKIANFI